MKNIISTTALSLLSISSCFASYDSDNHLEGVYSLIAYDQCADDVHIGVATICCADNLYTIEGSINDGPDFFGKGYKREEYLSFTVENFPEGEPDNITDVELVIFKIKKHGLKGEWFLLNLDADVNVDFCDGEPTNGDLLNARGWVTLEKLCHGE